VLEDQFSDMRNNTLTSTIWTMYRAANESQKKYILEKANKKLDLQEKMHLLKLLFETGAYSTISKEIKHNSRINRAQIKKSSLPTEYKKLFSQMCSLLESNKIYHYLQENYEKVKK